MPNVALLCIAATAVLVYTTMAASIGRGRPESYNQVPIRSSEDAELNCPSIPFQFPPGTIRCESCRAVGEALTFLIDKRSMHPVDALDAVCDALMENALLRQTRQGLRYWDLSSLRTEDEDARESFPLSSNSDKAEMRGSKSPVVGVDGEPEDPFRVTYHNEEERVVLPCAHYGLKRYCERYIESMEDSIDECIATYQANIKNGAASDEKLLSNPNRAPPSRGGKKLNRDIATEQLRHCLTIPICEVKCHDCYSRLIAQQEDEELQRYRKYQGAYGAKQFPYVGDREDRKLYERNPFASGGDRVKENDLLERPLEDRGL
jgi:hypothetical protein